MFGKLYTYNFKNRKKAYEKKTLLTIILKA